MSRKRRAAPSPKQKVATVGAPIRNEPLWNFPKPQQMLRRLLVILVFFAVALLVDRILWWGLHGQFLRCTRNLTDTEQGGGINQALASGADIVVLGSSRAKTQVNPVVLGRETGRTVYNAGAFGQGTQYMWGLTKLLLKKHPPSLLILCVHPLDILEGDGRDRRLSVLYPYLDDAPGMRDIFDVDRLQSRSDRWFWNLQTWIKTLRLNGRMDLIVLSRYWSRDQRDDGFVPLTGVFHWDTYFEWQPYTDQVDDVAVNALSQLVAEAHRHKVPTLVCITRDLEIYAGYDYKPDRQRSHALLLQLCNGLKVPTVEIDALQWPQLRDPNYYNDPMHLNHHGANLFSTILGQYLRQPSASNTE